MSNEILIKNIKTIPAFQRAILLNYNINNIKDLIELTEFEILRMPKIGKKTLEYIKSELKVHNLYLKEQQ